MLSRVSLFLLAGMVFVACGQTTEEVSPLGDLRLIAVDFELNSIVLTNTGTESVVTENLWAYKNGSTEQFDLHVVEPRNEIRFTLRELGELSNSGGEVALFDSSAFEDPGSLLDYVAWGPAEHQTADLANEAGLWGPGETLETDSDAIAALRVNPAAAGVTAWDVLRG